MTGSQCILLSVSLVLAGVLAGGAVDYLPLFVVLLAVWPMAISKVLREKSRDKKSTTDDK